MSDRKVGYGKPPEHSRFKKGVSANPKGRPKRQPPEVGEVIRAVMDAAVEYRESGRTRRRHGGSCRSGVILGKRWKATSGPRRHS